MSGANLKNAQLYDASLASATFDSTTVYNQWTHFSASFDPVAAGLTLDVSPPGDFDADNMLDAADVDMLTTRILRPVSFADRPPNAAFDLDDNGRVNREDHRIWVKDLMRTWCGDANLDGQFNSGDMVLAFTAGKYEISEEAGWAEGDWNADGVFSSSDMVTAFADGGYGQGPRMDAVAVPEPTSSCLLPVTGLIGIAICVCRRINDGRH